MTNTHPHTRRSELGGLEGTGRGVGATDTTLWAAVVQRVAGFHGVELGALAQAVVEEGGADPPLLAAPGPPSEGGRPETKTHPVAVRQPGPRK